MKILHYLDGIWVSEENLKVSAFDLSITRGFGVFDFLRTYHNKPFLLGQHLARFKNSAKTLGLIIPKNQKEIEKIVEEGIKKNSFQETNIKIILTGGKTEDGYTPVGKSTFIIMFTPATIYPKSYYEKGIELMTTPMSRIYPSVKTINYLTGVLALVKAYKQGCLEALYVDGKGKIYECITSNFFAVIGGRLVTPKDNILIGMTRQVVIKLAKRLKVSLEERSIYLKEIGKFQEAFITATNKEIMPVVRIDEKVIGTGKLGEITRKLIREFKKVTVGL